MFRGGKQGELASIQALRRREVVEHTGGVSEHARDIDRGSSQRTSGISLTKDPFVACRYATPTDAPFCVHGASIVASGRGRDFSTAAGGAALLAAGASDRAVRFARSDGEWRHEVSLEEADFVWAPSSGAGAAVERPLLLPAVALPLEGDIGPKRAFWSTLTQDVRSTVNEWAVHCDGRMPLRGEQNGPVVRLDWDEASSITRLETASVAHQSLTLHEEYDFTHACAVDGSNVPGDNGGHSAYGLWRGVRLGAAGGAMPPGSSIQDAELAAIVACVRSTAAALPARGAAPRLLVLSDCLSVLMAIERAWRGGDAWRLARQHRQTMLEHVLLARADWTRRGGAIVFQWVPSHRGILPNSYADGVAKAYVRGVPPPWLEELRRKASLVQYGVSRGGVTSWVAGDRQLRGLLQRELAPHVLSTLAKASRQSAGLVLHLPETRPELWPWRSCWRAVMAKAGWQRQRGGRRSRPTGVGAVMRVRSGQLGLPSDCAAPGGADGIAAIAAVWRRGDDGGAEGASVLAGAAVADALAAMASAVQRAARATQQSEYHVAVAGAAEVVAAMRRDGAQLPSEAEWRRARAVISGSLPQPSAAEMEATRAAATAATADHAGEGDADAERTSVTRRVVQRVADAAEAASTAACAAALAWRRQNRPVWRDVAPGDDELEEGEDDDEAPEPAEPDPSPAQAQQRRVVGPEEGARLVSEAVARLTQRFKAEHKAALETDQGGGGGSGGERGGSGGGDDSGGGGGSGDGDGGGGGDGGDGDGDATSDHSTGSGGGAPGEVALVALRPLASHS